MVAADALELLDHLGLDSVYITGTSGGSPHVLAFAALYPERVRAATVVVGAAPLLDEDTGGLIGLNREAWVSSQEGWDAMYAVLAPVRGELLRDPLGAFRRVMDAAPPADRAVMDDPDRQRVFIEDQEEALRPRRRRVDRRSDGRVGTMGLRSIARVVQPYLVARRG